MERLNRLRFTHGLRSQSGSALLIVLIGAILSFVAMLVTIMHFTRFNRAQTFFEIREDLVDIRQYLALNISCANTVGDASAGIAVPTAVKTACTTPSAPYITVIDSSDAKNTLIQIPTGDPLTYTTIGRGYQLRASCVACTSADNAKSLCGTSGYKFYVEVNRTNGSNVMTSRLNNWVDLYGGNPSVCLINGTIP